MHAVMQGFGIVSGDGSDSDKTTLRVFGCSIKFTCVNDPSLRLAVSGKILLTQFGLDKSNINEVVIAFSARVHVKYHH